MKLKVTAIIMLRGVPGSGKTIVHNTSTQKWEMDAYFDLAEKYDINIYSVVVENRHGSHNTHDVPFHSIVRMKDRFEVEL